MAQQIKLLLAMLVSHIGALVQVLTVLLLVQLFANVLGKVAKYHPSIPVTHMGDLDGVSSS